jgi:putative mRNA 3-end processing factor
VADDLIVLRREGLYCPRGDFYIDPWRPVPRAIITHAHADHARTGHEHYLAASPGARVLKTRLGDINLETLDYGQTLHIGDTEVTLFPAGHVLGSSQVRVRCDGVTWVASGDYKTAGMDGPAIDRDATCDPFEPVACDVFITESTFGLPIYRWQSQSLLIDEINQWWRKNAEGARTSVLFCYAFGKAQRLLCGIDASIGRIVCHGAVQALNAAYRESGIPVPATSLVSDTDRADLGRALVVAPPSAAQSPWLKRFGDYSDAFASGWMQLRGARRRRALDRGFVVSDHADWPGLRRAIAATGAGRVIVTHGQVAPLVRALRDDGLDAQAFETEYGDEEDDNQSDAEAEAKDAAAAAKAC